MKYLINVGAFATKYIEREYEIDINEDSDADSIIEEEQLFFGKNS